MVATLHHFRLASGAGSLGPSWGETGLALAGVSLFRRTDDGFAPRPVEELEALLKAAYERDLDASTVRGLKVAATALSQGDIGRAMIAALHLRLPDLSWEAASRLAKVDERLAKYNADQPRDWHGRWTSEGGGAADFEADSTSAAPVRSDASAHETTDDWGDPSRPHGGVLIPVRDQDAEGQGEGEGEPTRGLGDNGAPSDPPDDPVLGRDRVPEGWDHPGQIVNGKYVPAARVPILHNGMPWHQVTPDLVKNILRPPARGPAAMIIFVPRDHIGPMLIGSNGETEFEQPSGYDSVRLVGTPQVTYSGGAESEHGMESIKEGLKFAATNEFLTIYFNRTLGTITGRIYQSPIRPDVLAVARPQLDIGPRLEPYEILSGHQTLRERQNEMPLNIPGRRAVQGRTYKMAIAGGYLLVRYVGAYSPCS